MKSQPYRQRRPLPESLAHFVTRRVLGILLLLFLAYTVWLFAEIRSTAHQDHAQPADAIAVFGAAEYSGHPSPVLHARLDHALSLYNRQIAPLIITLGGNPDGNSGRSEGGVARDYLLANGVPYNRIIAETRSVDTEQQVERLATIARANNLHHLVVVSDGTHLFRILYLCRQQDLDVFTSPRPPYGNISEYDLLQRYLHEMIGYTGLLFHLDASRLHRLISGRHGD